MASGREETCRCLLPRSSGLYQHQSVSVGAAPECLGGRPGAVTLQSARGTRLGLRLMGSYPQSGCGTGGSVRGWRGCPHAPRDSGEGGAGRVGVLRIDESGEECTCIPDDRVCGDRPVRQDSGTAWAWANAAPWQKSSRIARRNGARPPRRSSFAPMRPRWKVRGTVSSPVGSTQPHGVGHLQG